MATNSKWQFENGTPIYLQIIDQISTDIVRGVLKPGDKMPSVRALALDAGVTPNTVQRALTALEEKGLVHTHGTSGRFVTEDAAQIRALKENKLETIIADFFENLEGLGLDRDAIVEAVIQYQPTENKSGKDTANGTD